MHTGALNAASERAKPVACYLERVAELRWRSSGPPFLSSPFVSLLYADSVPFVAANPLAGQSHQISHEFVQIE
jgi:hypothetical protein